MLHRAGTLLIPSGPAHEPDKMHLHIICTDPCAKSCQLIVPVMTWKNHLCDKTCILDCDDHPFIRYKSWIVYRAIKTEKCSTIDNGLRQGIFRLKQIMRADVFQRVCNGILESPYTKREHKKYFEQQIALGQIPVEPIASPVSVEEQ